MKTLAVLLLAVPAQAATSPAPINSTGSAIPHHFDPATPKDSAKPEIAKPHDPGMNCVTSNTTPEQRAARSDEGGACLPQADAFTRAGEAASYLAHYHQRYTPYANEMRKIEQSGKLKEYQTMINQCVSGSGDCGQAERAQVLKAMVHYNMGKEIRAQVLEGRTRAELMKSVDLGAKGWRELGVNAPKVLTKYNALQTGTLRKNTFRLDPKKIRVLDAKKLTQQERQELGSNFMNHFNEFVNNYSQTTQTHSRWHYVRARSSAVGAQNVYRAEWDGNNLDAKLGKTLINKERHDADVRSQNNAVVNEIVKSFKDDMRKDLVKRDIPDPNDSTKVLKDQNVHTYRVALSELGLGLDRAVDPNTKRELEPAEVAGALVATINKAIHETEEAAAKKKESERLPSSSGGSSKLPIVPTVSVDVERFDRFLDTIWPANVARQ